MSAGRLLDPFSTPDPPENTSVVRCDYCDNVATHASDDPFDSEINGNYEDQHFSCNDPTCIELMQEALQQSADDI